MAMKTFLSLLALLLICSNGVYAQSEDKGILRGFVYSSENEKPLAFANVFISSSMSGTSTDETGYFVMKNVSPGTQELVVSYLGYGTVKAGVKVKVGDKEPLTVLLKPLVKELDEVAVRPQTNAEIRREVRLKAKEYNRHLEIFSQIFFGSTANALKCEVVNPEVLKFEEDKEKGTFTVKATDLIEVENRALGYKVFFLLEGFVVQQLSYRFAGRTFFDSLPAKSEREARNWQKQRLETFKGSMRHFLYALGQNKLGRNGFRVYEMVPGPQGDVEAPAYDLKKVWRPGLPGENYIHFEKPLRIEYAHRAVYKDGIRMAPSSWLQMTVPLAVFYSNGNLQNPYAFSANGDWNKTGVADMLPFEYLPPTSLEVEEDEKPTRAKEEPVAGSIKG
jgi:hypothetical protein